MLARIQAFYNSLIQPQADQPQQEEHKLRLAATALMVEVMRVDDEKSEAEIDAIIQASMYKFGIHRREADELLQLATAELEDATDYHQFTSLINRGFDLPHKLQIIEFLWQVAYADGRLDMYEEHVVRKIADLIEQGIRESMESQKNSPALFQSVQLREIVLPQKVKDQIERVQIAKQEVQRAEQEVQRAKQEALKRAAEAQGKADAVYDALEAPANAVQIGNGIAIGEVEIGGDGGVADKPCGQGKHDDQILHSYRWSKSPQGRLGARRIRARLRARAR